MKTIFVDAVETLLIEAPEGFTLDRNIVALLESFPNTKCVLTSANDEQWSEFGLDKAPYETFTLKHNPEKADPKYYEIALEHFGLSAADVVYIEHSESAVKSAESVGILSYRYDETKRDIEALRRFLVANL